MKITKKELVDLIKEYPDDMPIILNGHSDGTGYDSAYGVDIINVKSRLRVFDGEFFAAPIDTEGSFRAIRIY